jgi:transcriptional regulator of acetoin/glycerol metabolism
LDRLFQSIGALGGCVILASNEGIAVDRRGRPAHDREFQENGLWTGTNWSESAAGTNGIGTALALGHAVTIHRDQHFLSANIGLSCSSAPVFDAEGQLAAVLDVSTAGGETGEAMAGLIAHAVGEAARRIESDLFHAAFPKARLITLAQNGGKTAALARPAIIQVGSGVLVLLCCSHHVGSKRPGMSLGVVARFRLSI